MFKKSLFSRIISSVIVSTIAISIGIGIQPIKAEEIYDTPSTKAYIPNANIRYRNTNITFSPTGQFEYLDIKAKATSDILNNSNYKAAYENAITNWTCFFNKDLPCIMEDVSYTQPYTATVSFEFETDPDILATNINAVTYLFDEKGICVVSNRKYPINGERATIDSIRKYYNCPTDNLLIKVKSAKIIIDKTIFDSYTQDQKTALLTHELGHVLGLGHNSERYSIMGPSSITSPYPLPAVQPKDKTDLTNMYKDFNLNNYSWNNNGWLQK